MKLKEALDVLDSKYNSVTVCMGCVVLAEKENIEELRTSSDPMLLQEVAEISIYETDCFLVELKL